MGKGDRRTKVKPTQPTGIPTLAKVTPSRNPGGRPKRDDTVALNQRCQRFGIPASVAARQIMAAEWAGDDLGRVLMRQMGSEDDIRALWRVWQAFLSSARTYRSRVLSIGGSTGSSLPLAPEPMQVDQSHSIDIRTGDQRDEDAKASWSRWSGHLRALSLQERETLCAVESGTSKPLWHQRAPTWAGIEAHAALAHLAEVVGGKVCKPR